MNDYIGVGSYQFQLRDYTLFTWHYRCETTLWCCEADFSALGVRLRAWRKTGKYGLLFLDQVDHLVDDHCPDPMFEMRSVMGQFVKSLDKKTLEAAKRQAADDAEMAGLFPALHEFMTLLAVGKEPREPSRLSIFTEDGQWKAFLNDPHTGRYVCVSSKTARGVLEALERTLASGEADWRVSKGFSKRK